MIERKRLKNYYLPAVLTVLMALALVPAATLAVTEWTYAASSVKYLDEKGVEQTADDCTSVSDIPDTAYPYLRGAGQGKAKWYVVDSDVSYNDYRLTISGNVHLILTDGHKLRASHGIRMAANDSEGASLTVYAQSTGDNMGQLEASASDMEYCAGIGGNEAESSGAVVINGGKIQANGGKYGAGIGGGDNRSADSITINGGDVTATGGDFGAGIGGGEGGSGGQITINGGKVTVSGGKKGAGLGGGQVWRGGGGSGNITIIGGEVTATGGDYAAGIGGGEDGDSESIAIRGGEVTATGGLYAAGIGGGEDGANKYITISGGTVKPTPGYDSEHIGQRGAGIGGGKDGDNHFIHITGGKIESKGRIGGGYKGDNEKIVIDDGNVHVTAGGGAAIGGGYDGDGGSIIINGGKIYAQAAGDRSSEGAAGAGIGGGSGGFAGDIIINGGDIEAHGGGTAGIGSGTGSDGGAIKINGGKIDAYSYRDKSASPYWSWVAAPAPGIGTTGGDGVSITITGGEISAHSSGTQGFKLGDWHGSTAIGGGYKTMSGPIKITGGKINAWGCSHRYMIGNGPNSKKEDDISQFVFDYPESMVSHSERAKVGGAGIFVDSSDRASTVFKNWFDDRYSMNDVRITIEPCDHHGQWKYNSHEHWKDGCRYCGIDGKKLREETYQAHGQELEWKHNNQNDWLECKVCGYKGELLPHDNIITEHDCVRCGIPMVTVTLRDSVTGEEKRVNGAPRPGYIAEYTLPENPFSAPDGKIFLGWQIGGESNSSSTVYKTGESVRSAEDILLTAVYTGDPDQLRTDLANGKDVTLQSDYYIPSDGPALQIPEGKKSSLDMNGYSIRRNEDTEEKGIKDGYILKVDGELTLKDSKGGSTISGGRDAESATGTGAGAAYVKGTLDMQGGTMSNHLLGKSLGGAVTVDGGTFRMSGGTIKSCVSLFGSAVFAINGGKIELNGGQIIDNIALGIGSVYLDRDCSISVSGAPVVSGTRNMSGKLSNLALQSGQELQIADTLSSEAKISVTSIEDLSGGKSIRITNGFAGKGSISAFTSDDESLSFGTKDGEVMLGSDVVSITVKAEAPLKDMSSGAKAAGNKAEPENDETGERVLYGLRNMELELFDCNIRPPQGKVFSKWNVNGEEYDPMDLIMLTDNVVMYPVWRDQTPGMQRVIITAGEGGKADYYETVEAATGETVVISAEPDEGYEFKEWKVIEGDVTLDGGFDQFFNEFVMGDKDVEIQAVFQPIPVERVSLYPSNLFLEEGETATVELDIAPYDARNKNVSWDLDDKVATMTKDDLGNAVVTGKAAGVSEMLVQSEDGGHSAICNVVVLHKELKHVEAKEPTLDSDGNIEYWFCDTCDQYYKDPEGFDEIKKDDTVVKLTEKEEEELLFDAFFLRMEKAEARTTKIKSVKAKKGKKAKVTWKKTSGAAGYVITYSTSKTFKNGVKMKIVKGQKKTKATLKKLKKGKTYYVKVAPYSKVTFKELGGTYEIKGKDTKAQRVKARK